MCQAGYWCKQESTLRSPIQEYAVDWSPSPETSPIGTVTNWWEYYDTDTSTERGGICTEGNYCPESSSTETPCAGGFYCPDEFLKAASTLECREGFYCSGGASVATPGNWFWDQDPSNAGWDSTGDICRPGNYCPANQSRQFPCSPGQFMPYVKAENVNECIACPAGKYCNTSGIADLTGTINECREGYYCSGSATSDADQPCSYD